MIWLVEHADGYVKILDQNRTVVFESNLRAAATHLAYCLDDIRVRKEEAKRLGEEIQEIRRHNADLMNELTVLKTQQVR